MFLHRLPFRNQRKHNFSFRNKVPGSLIRLLHSANRRDFQPAKSSHVPLGQSSLFSRYTLDFVHRSQHKTLIQSSYFSSSSAFNETSADVGDSNTNRRVDNNLLDEDELPIERRYTRKNPIEHILLRPGMYIGPTERLPPSPTWILDHTPLPETGNDSVVSSTPGKPQILRKEVPQIPALLKIFDEILVNASDNAIRKSKSPTTRIEVIIDPRGNPSLNSRHPFIRIRNNGTGIPIQVHKTENMYVPEMLFGHLLTGSNFNDDGDNYTTVNGLSNVSNKRLTGGRHGYGAKLTNIFSKWFEVETCDVTSGKIYRQTWEKNMSKVHPPEIFDIHPRMDDNLSPMEEYTQISFIPDMKQLWRNYTEDDLNSDSEIDGRRSEHFIPQEDFSIMCKRVYDVAGTSRGNVIVSLNGQIIPIHSFEEYSKLYRGDLDGESEQNINPVLFHKLHSGWEVGIGLSTSGSFESVSFVNGMATTRGGTHVDAIVRQVTKYIIETISRNQPELAAIVTQAVVKRCLCIFINSLIENPTFDSQMKESLTSNPSSFSNYCVLANDFLEAIVKEVNANQPDGGLNCAGQRGLGIIEEVTRICRGRMQSTFLKELGGHKRSRRHYLSIPKLDDANLAGTANSSRCTLILTEGDSAKALAVSGLEVIGRDLFGVFPLRGKFLNVRDASVTQLANNTEVKSLCTILGLDFDETYESALERSKLRYGHVMLMTDQDTDGSHIKGLVLNFFRRFWPALLKPPLDASADEKPFLSSFVTPLIKARSNKENVLNFFSIMEYLNWRKGLSDDQLRKWTIKYYKGLGTSTHAEAKEYFKDFSRHHRPFRWDSDEDGNLIDMVFDRGRANDRKHWITNVYEPSATSHPSTDNSVSFQDFINSDMIHFSNADNVRSLPSVVDGLKPSQRKVLYACFKRKLKNEIKVAQLSGYCAEHTAYHHGEASLHATIIGMAQDFVGASNINLLQPSGQFGTRITGGDDAASPRYIFTYLSPLARLIFPEVDDSLLDYLEEDGYQIEPKYYYPVIPLLLCNGCQGIGTGWSTFVPPHSPRDLIEYVRAKLKGDSPPIVKPWVRGFSGTIGLKDDMSGYRTAGIWKRVSRTSVLISELPVGRWTNDYKEFLVKLQNEGAIQDFKENHTATSVSFLIQVKSARLDRMISRGIDKVFKLETSLPLTNMHAYDTASCISKYNKPEDIMEAYYPARLRLYHRRKHMLERNSEYHASILNNKARFIEMVTEGKIDLTKGNRSKMDTVSLIRELGFTSKQGLDKIRLSNPTDYIANGFVEDAVINNNDELKDYDYLLELPLSALTSEKISTLLTQASKANDELEITRRKSAEVLWSEDLDRLAYHLEDHLKTF